MRIKRRGDISLHLARTRVVEVHFITFYNDLSMLHLARTRVRYEKLKIKLRSLWVTQFLHLL